MTPEEFVVALKKGTRESVRSTAEYLANPPVPSPPEHLGEFATFWRSLDPSQQETLKDLMTYVAEGALFHLLDALDHGLSIEVGNRGRLELRWVADDGTSVLLNDTDGEFLHDIFNNTP